MSWYSCLRVACSLVPHPFLLDGLVSPLSRFQKSQLVSDKTSLGVFALFLPKILIA